MYIGEPFLSKPLMVFGLPVRKAFSISYIVAKMLAVKTNQKLVQLLLGSRKNCIEALSFEICIVRPEFVLENPHKLFNLC